MIKTAEVITAIKRKHAGDIPRLISTKEFLPFVGEYVPIITADNEVMRGLLVVGGEEKLYWNGAVMHYGSGERQLSLDQVLYWLG